MDYEKINRQQETILTQINSHEKTKTLIKSRLLCAITEFEPKEVQIALGNLGSKLRAFAAEVDLMHPDLIDFCDESFCTAAMELLSIARMPFESDYVQSNLRRVITKHHQHKQLSRIIDAPTKNLLHCRFAKPEFWSEIRNLKRTQKVDLRVLISKGEDFWEECPEDFSSYARNLNRLLPLIEEATSQHEHFTNFGLTSMAREIEDQLAKIVSESQDERYYGFNRITMTAAAVTLGKLHGATFQIGKTDYSSNQPNFRCRFSCSPFWGNRHFDSLNQEFSLSFMNYTPLIIPVTQMERKSGEMVSLLNDLDSWPETDGKPIFDNYWVMMPDFNITGDHELMYDLVEDHKLTGVLLGEKDGDVYFVSYWI